jgi:hypothetical protein
MEGVMKQQFSAWAIKSCLGLIPAIFPTHFHARMNAIKRAPKRGPVALLRLLKKFLPLSDWWALMMKLDDNRHRITDHYMQEPAALLRAVYWWGPGRERKK